MKILVTGAAGFLGSSAIRAALERGHEARALVRPTSDRSRLAEVPEGAILEGDMTDHASLRRAAEGVDAVIHCAATTSEGAPDLELSRRTNVEGTRALIEAMIECGGGEADGAARWIQISSMSAHSATTSVYGRTKLEADEVVRASALRWTILRPSLIYGPGGKGLVDKTVRIMRKLPVMPVVGSGREPMRPVYVADAASAALDCLENPATIGKTYMIGGRDEISLNEFLAKLGAAAGARRPAIHLPIPVALLIARALGLITKNPPLTVDNVLGVKQVQRVEIGPAQADFGFDPIGFEEGLKRTFGAEARRD